MDVNFDVFGGLLGLGNFYIKGRRMNKENVIRMAQKAQMPFYWRTGEITYLDKLERFAALIASAEREACAEVGKYALPNHSDLGLVVEAAIRARGQA